MEFRRGFFCYLCFAFAYTTTSKELYTLTFSDISQEDVESESSDSVPQIYDKNIEEMISQVLEIDQSLVQNQNQNYEDSYVDEIKPSSRIKNCGIGQICVSVDPLLLENVHKKPILRAVEETQSGEAESLALITNNATKLKPKNWTSEETSRKEGSSIEITTLPYYERVHPTEYIPEEAIKDRDPTAGYPNYEDYLPYKILREIFNRIYRSSTNNNTILPKQKLNKEIIITENIVNDPLDPKSDRNKSESTVKANRKFSKDYIDVDELLSHIELTTTKRPGEESKERIIKPVSLDYIDPDGNLVSKVIPPEILKKFHGKTIHRIPAIEARKVLTKKMNLRKPFDLKKNQENIKTGLIKNKYNQKIIVPLKFVTNILTKLKKIKKLKKENPVSNNEKLISKKEKPVSKEEKPVSKKGMPISKKEKPVSKKENPVSKKEKPVSKKEKHVIKKEKPVIKKEPAKVWHDLTTAEDADTDDENITYEDHQDLHLDDQDEDLDEEKEEDGRDQRKRTPPPKKRTPKRFQIVDSLNDNYSPEVDVSDDDLEVAKTSESIDPISVESTTKKLAKKRPRIPGKPEHYMQGTHLFTEGRDFRKRLSYFLPKRYHWDTEEFQDLGYFWFNGPQGRNPPGAAKMAW